MTKQDTFTPGPWVSSEGGETGYPNVETLDGYALAEMLGCREQDYENARLMSLAPELLKALERDVILIEQLCHMVNQLSLKTGLGRKVRTEDWTSNALTAIRKAKGE